MARSLVKLPGLVDVHVHLREPGATHKEDFETGTRAAIAGGYTQILDMPNNTPPTITKEALNKKINLAQKRIYCDVGFHFGAKASSVKYFKSVSNKVFSLKVYMNQTTGPLLVNEQKDRELIFKSWQSSLPIMVHAEGDTIEVAIKLAKIYQRRLHICHVTSDQLESITRARKENLAISCEVCPHHLFLNTNDATRLGPFAMMKPSLLTKSGQLKLWDNLHKIDMISTDHAPHTKEEKKDLTSQKFGVPGLETTLPLMLTAVSRGLITLERLTQMLCNNPRKIFKLPQQKDTFILVDFAKSYKITNANLFTKCGWTPFLGHEGRGKVAKVVIRGQTVFENGQFVTMPCGKVIYPITR